MLCCVVLCCVVLCCVVLCCGGILERAISYVIPSTRFRTDNSLALAYVINCWSQTLSTNSIVGIWQSVHRQLSLHRDFCQLHVPPLTAPSGRPRCCAKKALITALKSITVPLGAPVHDQHNDQCRQITNKGARGLCPDANHSRSSQNAVE